MGLIFGSPSLTLTPVNVVDICKGDHIAVKRGFSTDHALFMGHEKGTVIMVDKYSQTIVETSIVNMLLPNQPIFLVTYGRQFFVSPAVATQNAARLVREQPFTAATMSSFRFVHHVRINCHGHSINADNANKNLVYGMGKKHNLDQSIPCSSSIESHTEHFPLAGSFLNQQQLELETPQNSIERYPVYRCEPVQGFKDYNVSSDNMEATPTITPTASPTKRAGGSRYSKPFHVDHLMPSTVQLQAGEGARRSRYVFARHTPEDLLNAARHIEMSMANESYEESSLSTHEHDTSRILVKSAAEQSETTFTLSQSDSQTQSGLVSGSGSEFEFVR